MSERGEKALKVGGIILAFAGVAIVVAGAALVAPEVVAAGIATFIVGASIAAAGWALALGREKDEAESELALIEAYKKGV